VVFCALADRDADAAEAALAAMDANAKLGDDAVQLSREFAEGLLARMNNDPVRAQAAFTAARGAQEKLLQQQPDYGPALCILGLIDAGLGRKEQALASGRRAMELLPIEKDSVNGVHMISYFAVIAAWVGEPDAAIEHLARAAKLPGTVTFGGLKLLPWWDPLPQRSALCCGRRFACAERLGAPGGTLDDQRWRQRKTPRLPAVDCQSAVWQFIERHHAVQVKHIRASIRQHLPQ
jgi:tetratricopeptide (TPR) repeat protein